MLKTALEAVSSCATPNTLPQAVPGQAYDITIAHNWHEMLGVNEALRLLKNLASKNIEELENEQEEEWEYMLPKELQ